MLCVLCLIFWAVKKRIFFWYNFIIILVTYTTFSSIFSIGLFIRSKPDNTKNITFKLMSWNVRLFDVYNWSNSEKTKSKIFDLLDEQSPDIICFQEFYYDGKKRAEDRFITKDKIKEILKTPYVHEVYTDTARKRHYFGTALFSKYPIVYEGKIKFESAPSNVCQYTDIQMPNQDTIRIYNVHLASIRLTYSDYQFLDNIDNETDTIDLEEGSKSIFSRMKKAYLARATQVELIKEHISRSPHPVILCGDFNDPSFSYTYKTLTEHLSDAFIQSGFFLGPTYANYIPVFRIDYVLYDHYFCPSSFETIYKKYSDHYPVTTQFTIKEDEYAP